MAEVDVVFAPQVDAAVLAMIDYAAPDDALAIVDFIERAQRRLVNALGTFPEAGAVFQGAVRMFPIGEYVFLYEYHAALGQVHVLDMLAPGRNWR